jgi:hypothetical protein
MQLLFPCAFFASQKTGLSASIFWLCQKDLRYNPLRPTGFRSFGISSFAV